MRDGKILEWANWALCAAAGASLAIIFAHAFWSVSRLWWGALGLDALMLPATPTDGGHSFVDMFAGIAMAVLVLAAAQRAVVWSWPKVLAPSHALIAGDQRP